MTDDLLSLDELFSEARAHVRVEAAAAKRKQERKAINPEKPCPQALYADPANWTRTRGVALVHRETKTLLGNFSEYVHVSVPDCRRLVREESPISVSAIEEVSGEWGWAGPGKDTHQDSSLSVRELVLGVCLSAPEVNAIAALRVHLQGAGILRVELAEDTHFGSPEQFLLLPAETNILSVLAHHSKVNLREALA